MYSTASFTVLICSVSSSGISMPNCSSSASTSSTTARESALRSSVNEASGRTCSGPTSSCAQMISLTFASTSIVWLLVRGRVFLHQKAAVDAHDLSGHVAGRLRREEAHRLRHVLGLADASERDLLEQRLAVLSLHVRGGHVGLD